MKKSIWFYIFWGIFIAVCLVCLILSVYYVVTSICSMVILGKQEHYVALQNYIKILILYLFLAASTTMSIAGVICLLVRIYGKNAPTAESLSYEEYCTNRMNRSAVKRGKKRERLEEKLERLNK